MYNIVIVEDEPIELESLHRIISQNVDNAVLHTAATGKKAIQLIDELNKIDMMFVDINIPLPDGKQVIEYLKSKDLETKVVVTTANDDFDIIRSMLNLRVEDYLLKPVKNAMLIDTIKKVLGFNDGDVAVLRTLKHELTDMIKSCNYTKWHDFLFKNINKAYSSQNNGHDSRHEIKNILDTLVLYLESWDDRFLHCCKKIKVMTEKIEHHGLSCPIYSQLILMLLEISREIFDLSFKSCQSNMNFIDRAKFHIEKNIMNNITLDYISEKSFVSSCYLSRAFKKSMDVGFSNYVSLRKIDIACSLLQFGNLKVNTIALELSWEDSNYFCRIFKKETGMAPSDYRREFMLSSNNY